MLGCSAQVLALWGLEVEDSTMAQVVSEIARIFNGPSKNSFLPEIMEGPKSCRS